MRGLVLMACARPFRPGHGMCECVSIYLLVCECLLFSVSILRCVRCVHGGVYKLVACAWMQPLHRTVGCAKYESFEGVRAHVLRVWSVERVAASESEARE